MGTIHIYPTSAEINKFVANGWRPQSCADGLLRFAEYTTACGVDRRLRRVVLVGECSAQPFGRLLKRFRIVEHPRTTKAP